MKILIVALLLFGSGLSVAELPVISRPTTSGSILLEGGSGSMELPEDYVFSSFSTDLDQNQSFMFTTRHEVDRAEKVEIEITGASLINVTNMIGQNTFQGAIQELAHSQINNRPVFRYLFVSEFSEYRDGFIYLFHFDDSTVVLSGESEERLDEVADEILSTYRD